MLEDLKTTLEGGVADSAPVNQHILRFAKKTAEYRASLSERELEIIKLLANGYCQKEAANKLGIKSTTINTHQKNIYSKLRVCTLAEATKVLSLL